MTDLEQPTIEELDKSIKYMKAHPETFPINNWEEEFDSTFSDMTHVGCSRSIETQVPCGTIKYDVKKFIKNLISQIEEDIEKELEPYKYDKKIGGWDCLEDKGCVIFGNKVLAIFQKYKEEK